MLFLISDAWNHKRTESRPLSVTLALEDGQVGGRGSHGPGNELPA